MMPFSVLPRPTALAKALLEVRGSHPYFGDGDVDGESGKAVADAQVIWDRLASLTGSQLQESARALLPREARLLAATAPSRLGNRACRAVLASVMTHHVLPDESMLAWEAWLSGDGGEPLFHVRAQAAPLSAGAASQTWTQLLTSATPSECLAALWRQSTLTFEEFVRSPSISLSQYQRFLNLTRLRLLSRANLYLLNAREPLGFAITEWVNTLIDAHDRLGWYRDFLEITSRGTSSLTNSRQWPLENTVCIAIQNLTGPPADDRAFWKDVSTEARAAFALWLRDRELTGYLGGENDRVDFWRRYLVQLQRMVRSRDRSTVLLYFDGWVAVQFVDSGKATFLFQEHAVRNWQLFPELRLYSTACRLRRQANSGYLDSYEQRGHVHTWQARASETVSAVLRRFG